MKTERYDAIIIGAGHAGIEASLALARAGYATLMLTINLDTIGQMSCNPAIGGIAKGHIVREIDALGGQMAKTIDQTAIQFRMLNKSKGPAVWAPRAQADKLQYQRYMKFTLESEPNLTIKQEMVESLIVSKGKIKGVCTQTHNEYMSNYVIVTTGTFLRGMIHIGAEHYQGGRDGELSSLKLSICIKKEGIISKRFKTGTPPRINKKSVDLSVMIEQPGDPTPLPFSFANKKVSYTQIPCYLTHTNEKTHRIMNRNLKKSALFCGNITGVGPRYCPSMELKLTRFKDRASHQLYLEPEGRDTNEIYLNGFSSSLPKSVQIESIRTIKGLENVEIMRYAYAIEYDYFPPTQLQLNLETRKIKNLFFAGQINGTSGYEEAAGQGLMAGLNVIRKLRKQSPFILKRSEAYIGILIDDLVTKGTNEPYRMFTSLAEFRLLLRQDNADLRLMKYGYDFGLIPKKQFDFLERKRNQIQKLELWLHKTSYHNASFAKILRRQDMTYERLAKKRKASKEVIFQAELNIKYEGYISRQHQQIERFKKLEKFKIPCNFNFLTLKGVKRETIDKLSEVNPLSIGQASRIPGIGQDDLSMLVLAIKKQNVSRETK
ncbi:tRNA uridine-5-carboxymethylaminomethyl(34) synthesis enzyme MnmG [Candidatus Omnitrophota bacterium]